MTDSLVIGGGPAGAAAAIHLARAGAAPVLLERTTGPTDKVCGDFLSVEAASELGRLGLDLDRLGASTISRLRVVHGRRVAETDLPFTARGLSRGILDEALLARASEAGVRVHRGIAAQALRPDGGGFVCRTNTEDQASEAVFLATGKHDLRGVTRSAGRSQALGLKTYAALTPEQHADLHGHVELILFRGGYLGLQPVEGGRAVLCTMVEKARFAAMGGSWPALLASVAETCPHLRTRLAGAVSFRDKPLAVAGIPYGYVHRSEADGRAEPFRVGDQVCVIPSLTGDGVALALHGARLAARTWISGGSSATYHGEFASYLTGQMRVATILHRLLLGPGAAWATALGSVAPGLLREAARRTRVHGTADRRADAVQRVRA